MTSRVAGAIAEAAKAIDANGLAVAGAGNVSALLGATMLITRSGLRLGSAVASDVSVVDLADASWIGPRPSSETELHRAVYATCDARAIVHFHGSASTALGTVAEELPAIHYGVHRLGGPVPVVQYHRFGSHELAAAVGRFAAGRAALLLRNHGAVVWGDDLATAVERALLLEWMCDVYLRARAIGEPRLLSDGELADVAEHSERVRYGALAADTRR